VIPASLLRDYPRIALVGPPKAGKTTMAALVTDRPVFHTDDHPDFHKGPEATMKLLANEKRYLVEGIHVWRMLRKGFTPDLVIELTEPHEELTPKQASLAKGMERWRADWMASKPGILVVTL
jgi:broad-specificity NMP kinase